MPIETLEVQGENTADAPVVHEFDSYVTRRQAELSGSPEEDLTEVTTDPPEESEPAASEPAKEEPAATQTESEAKPAESAPADQQEKKNKGGIPQDRLDEVTKARREAETRAETEKKRADDLEKQIQELKAAKPAEEPKKPTPEPSAAKTEPELTAPSTTPSPKPDPNGDKYPMGVVDPQYIEDLADWKMDERDRVKAVAEYEKNKTERETKAKTEAESRAKTETERAEAAAADLKQNQKRIDEAFAATKVKYPDLEARIEKQKHVYVSTPLQSAVQDSDAFGEVLNYLVDHPEETTRISSLTKLADDATATQMRRATNLAAIEVSKIEALIANQTTTVAEPAKAEEPPKPKPPANPKPAVSGAPPPPKSINPSAGPAPDAKPSNFEDYERKRLVQQAKSRR